MSQRGLVAHLVVRRPGGFELDVSLSIDPGETVALLGPNGAGKSTAVAAIAGLLPIDSGSITLDGVILDSPDSGVFLPAEKRRVGVVFQDYLLFPHLSTLENVAFGLRSRGVERPVAFARAQEWLELLGLQGLERSKPGDLSGGQAQRVALARALVIEPELLLLDEPLSALDVTTRVELRRALGEHLAAFDGARLLITHDPTEAFLLADRVAIIESGQVTQTGSPDEILLRPKTRYAADLAGSNLLMGTSIGGRVVVGDHRLNVADQVRNGPVLVTIPSTAVSLHTHRPDGSPRNTWATTVERIEVLGSRARIRTGDPLPLTVELTEVARMELALQAGSPVWVAVKATEIGVESEASPDAPPA